MVEPGGVVVASGWHGRISPVPRCSYPVRGDHCAREAHFAVADLDLCRQHRDAIAHQFETPLLVELADLQRELDALQRRRQAVAAPVDQPEPDLHLYFAEIPHITPQHPRFGLIKIGRTINLSARMEALGTVPIKTKVIEQWEETETHHRFAHLRVEGEWFRAEPDLLAFIEAL